MSEHNDSKMDDADSELHIEVTPLSPPPNAGQQTSTHRRNARLWRALIAGTAIVVALTIIFSGLLPLRTPLTGWALPQPTATSTAMPTPVLLGKVPTNCPPGNSIQTFSPAFGPGVGVAGLNVWLIGFEGPQAILRFTGGAQLTPHGWPYKLILAAPPDVTQPITLSASGMGGTLWFSVDGVEHTTEALTLDPRTTLPSTDGWRGWPLYIFVPSAGCYYLALHYSGQEMPGTYFAAGM